MTSIPVRSLSHQTVLMLALCTGGTKAAESPSPLLSAERLWLPPSQEQLLPLLHRAVEMALTEPDCNQVLYASLNEFRTDRGEPAFTILCQQDQRTTFNRVYRVSEVDATMAGSAVAGDAGENNLDTLRRLLMSDNELRQQSASVPDNDTDPASTEDHAEDEPGNSLELDLDDLMRNRRRSSENPPELF